jgi:flavin-dependent dehydrogenase
VNQSHSLDVIVVGGGPGGSVAAKRCAESGLSTLLIERKRLPRDKVCSGMVMGEWAHGIIRREFGEIPGAVLVDPPYLRGHRLYVAGAEPLALEWHTPLTWRKDLDYWLLQRARKSGAAIQEESRVVRVASEEGVCRVTVRRQGKMEEFRARFVIAADGGASEVRRSIFPELKVRYSAPIRECYRGALEFERDWIHWFFPKGRAQPRFNVNHKNKVFLIEGRAIRELRTEIEETLAPYGFQPQGSLQWKDACPIALLHEQLLSRAFVPAQGNVLLVGDAAGLILPITFEGIGSALKSGILAAESIVRSVETGRSAAASYLEELEGVLEAIGHLCAVQNDLAAERGPRDLATAILAAYRETLTIQE